MAFGISIEREASESTTVQVKVDTGLQCQRRVIVFGFDAGSQFAAELLVGHIRDKMRTTIQGMLKLAYSEGWRDKASHKSKRDCFTGNLTDGPVVFPTR